ncbi:sperm-associated antigen 5 [Lampris incognitus]|uniref:sperm-associated antigen 5 n=1 Tax=Lampris incognitus TaxID=2546036 RepID=UPI0024B48192|nr:sperm-associated antigen 5 [Lampris incognitus]
MPEPQCEGLFSETSAFNRITPVTPKKRDNVEDTPPVTPKKRGNVEEADLGEQSNMAELLEDLGNTVSELVSTLKMVQQNKDTEVEELRRAICSLQGEQQAMTSKHMAEVWELKDQLGHMNSQAEKGNMALQQKNQDEKMLTKLFTEVNEAGELLNNYKTDNNELRKEVVALRTSLQQSMVESQVLRDELRKVSSLSANSEQFMDEKIFLLKEMERLKGSLKNMEQARAKLLDRAKRHQMIHQSNQQKMEDELRTLDNMIDTVRKTLSSVPQVVKNCDQLKWLVEYIG